MGMPALRLVEGSAPASDQGPSSAFDVPVEADGQPTDEEALDAYSRAVSGVAEKLAPSVASLRVTRRTRRGRVQVGRRQRRGAHPRRLPAHLRARGRR